MLGAAPTQPRTRSMGAPVVPASRRTAPQPSTDDTTATAVTPSDGRRAPVYSTTCFRCNAHVPQRDTSARVCDIPRCVRIACASCHPNLDDTLECPDHTGWVTTLLGPDGPQRHVASVAPTTPTIPDGALPALSALFAAVAVMLVTTLASAAVSMERAWRFFTSFLRFYGIHPDQVTPFVVMSYMLARCRPPIGVPIPDFMARRVQPRTAAQDLSVLRRRARLTKDSRLLAALTDEDVLRLGGVLGANVKRAKTNKAPILIHHLVAAWTAATDATYGFIRNMLLLVIGLVAGLRRRELVALTVADAVWCPVRKELTLCVRRDKTNVTVTGAQQPRRLCVAHNLLTQVWETAAATPLGSRPHDAPLIPKIAGRTILTTPLNPSTVNTIVRETLPGLPVSPHSLRVGFATELHAAGVPLQTILELGRWSSLAGLLYVLPSADQTTAATRRMGEGGVVFERVLLQRSLGTAQQPPVARRLPDE